MCVKILANAKIDIMYTAVVGLMLVSFFSPLCVNYHWHTEVLNIL